MRIGPALGRISVLLLFSAACLSCHRQTQFEKHNAEGLRNNPPGVKFILRTQDGRSRFHLYETIPIEFAFSSDQSAAYLIELDESMNAAGLANRFFVSDTDSILRILPSSGFVCCESKKRFLSPREQTLKRELTDFLRFEKPGRYSLFVVTRRIFPQMGEKNDFMKASDLTVTSTMLTLEILPDDPKWDAQQLASTLQKLKDPKLEADYFAAVDHAGKQNDLIDTYFELANVVPHTDFAVAQKSLNAIETDEAIRERVKLIQMESQEELAVDRRFGGRTGLPQPVLESTTRPGPMVSAFEERAAGPDFGVDLDYCGHWSSLTVQRDHPEFWRFSNDETQSLNPSANYNLFENKAEMELLTTLESMLQNKTGKAKEVTQLTIEYLKRQHHQN